MRNKSELILIIVFVFFIVKDGFSQSTPTLDATRPADVVSPSPVAASLFNEVATPVNYYTGTPEINLPLYTIKVGSIEMPITLQYTATGIKVEQESGWVGLGWDLSTGGAIGRAIVGTPDEASLTAIGGAGYRASAAYLNMPEPGNDLAMQPWLDSMSACNLEELAQGKLDLMPDNYFMNFNGNSARLFFDKNSKPYFSPFKAWKLTGNEDSGFRVITEDGTTYCFDLSEYSSCSVETIPGDDHTKPINGNTSWYLTRIISANKTDTLNISYQPVNYSPVAYNPSESYSVLTQGQSATGCAVQPVATNSSKTYSTQNIQGYILKSISSKNQRVDFLASANRLDIPDTSTGMPYKLDSILIYNTSSSAPDKLLRKFIFNYDYFTNSNCSSPLCERLKLISIEEVDSLSNPGKEYKFAYSNSGLPDKNSKAQDMWGYYNGVNSNTTLIPTFTDNYGTQWNGADRHSDTSYTNIGMLQQIQYPTGGFTSFEYEANRYATNLPGARDSVMVAASSLTNTGFIGYPTPASAFDYFSVTYGQYVTVTSNIQENVALVGEGEVHIFDASNHSIYYNASIGLQSTTLYLNPGTYKLTADKSSINSQAYIRVDYQAKQATSIPGIPAGGARIKRILQFDGKKLSIKRFQYQADSITSSGIIFSTPMYSDIQYSPQICPDYGVVGQWSFLCYHSVSTVALGRTQGSFIGYSKVTVLDGDSGENGKEEFFYSVGGDTGGGNYPYAPLTSLDDFRGLLLQKNTYDDEGRLLEKEENEFQLSADTSSLNFKKVFGVKAGVRRQGQTYIDGCPALSRTFEWEIDSRLYATDQLWPILTSTKKTDYNTKNAVPISTNTQLSYDAFNLMPITKQTTNSKGAPDILNFKYPANFVGTPVYDSMVARNTISPVIEIDRLTNNNLVKKSIQSYQLWNSGNYKMIVPLNKQEQNGANALEIRTSFDNYDNFGNLLQQHKVNDINHSYLWDYNSTYPIAEVTNAAYADIAYSSFEADGKGNWTFTGTPNNSGGAITGTQSYPLDSGAISKSGLTSATKYIISYWSKGSVTISGGTQSNPITGKTINGWTYHELMITSATSVSISGSTYIDELRLYPYDAQMTTYTYEPLVGMTSQCGVDNTIQYYEYDGLGRLLDIKDPDGNILKTFEYHYQSPQQ